MKIGKVLNYQMIINNYLLLKKQVLLLKIHLTLMTLKWKLQRLQNMIILHCLLYLGDSVTTDHISPAGKISRLSSAS